MKAWAAQIQNEQEKCIAHSCFGGKIFSFVRLAFRGRGEKIGSKHSGKFSGIELLGRYDPFLVSSYIGLTKRELVHHLISPLEFAVNLFS